MNKINYFLKEIEYLKNEDFKEDLKYLLTLLPDYFYKIPASTIESNYPKYSLSKNGLVKLTKVSVRIALDLFETTNYTDHDKDLIIMALVLHDGVKKGLKEEDNENFLHPLILSKLILENTNNLKMNIDDIRRLCSLIESHMGKWNKDKSGDELLPIPRDEMQRFVHRCDYLASRSYLSVKFDKLNIL